MSIMLARFGAILAATLTAVGALTPPAVSAPQQRGAWNTRTVCVQTHRGTGGWYVGYALREWTNAPGPRFVHRRRCAASGSVDVYVRRMPNRPQTGLTWTDRDRHGRIDHVKIVLNPATLEANYGSGWWRCLRRYTTAHEFGHAVGLRDVFHRHPGAVMSEAQWWHHCGGLTAFDVRQARKLLR